jgi:hypothetical protein
MFLKINIAHDVIEKRSLIDQTNLSKQLNNFLEVLYFTIRPQQLDPIPTNGGEIETFRGQCRGLFYVLSQHFSCGIGGKLPKISVRILVTVADI